MTNGKVMLLMAFEGNKILFGFCSPPPNFLAVQSPNSILPLGRGRGGKDCEMLSVTQFGEDVGVRASYFLILEDFVGTGKNKLYLLPNRAQKCDFF